MKQKQQETHLQIHNTIIMITSYIATLSPRQGAIFLGPERYTSVLVYCETHCTVRYTIYVSQYTMICDNGRQNIRVTFPKQYTYNANHTCQCIDKIAKSNVVHFPHVYLTIIYVKFLHYYFFQCVCAIWTSCERRRNIFCSIVLST